MPYTRSDVAFIRVSRAVADRLIAAPVSLKLRGHDARIRAADKLLSDAMDKAGVPRFDDVPATPTEPTSQAA